MSDDTKDELKNIDNDDNNISLRITDDNNNNNDDGYDDVDTINIFYKILCYLVIFTCCALFVFGFNLLFSNMWLGFGPTVFIYLSNFYNLTWGLGLGLTISLFFLLVLDIYYWKGVYLKIGYFLLGLITMGYLIWAVLLTKSFVASAISVYLILAPAALLLVKKFVLIGFSRIHFLTATFGSLLICGAAMLGVWIGWLIIENAWWTNEIKASFYIDLNCHPEILINYESMNSTVLSSTLKSLDAVDPCTEAFLTWAAPLIMSCDCIVMSFVVFFLLRSEIEFQKNQKRNVDALTRVFISFFLLGLLGLWSAAGISGAELGLSSVVFTLAILSLVVAGSAIVATVGWNSFKEDISQLPLAARALDSVGSDWIKALMFILVSPVIILIIPVSILQQFFRKTLPFTKPLEHDSALDNKDHGKNEDINHIQEDKLIVTLVLAKFYFKVRKWDMTSVVTKIIYLGIAFFFLVVGVGRIVNVFLGWLNVLLSGLTLVPITFIFIAVGKIKL